MVVAWFFAILTELASEEIPMTPTTLDSDAVAQHCLNRLGEYLLKGYSLAMARLGILASVRNESQPIEADLDSRISDELMVYGAVLYSIQSRNTKR